MESLQYIDLPAVTPLAIAVAEQKYKQLLKPGAVHTPLANRSFGAKLDADIAAAAATMTTFAYQIGYHFGPVLKLTEPCTFAVAKFDPTTGFAAALFVDLEHILSPLVFSANALGARGNSQQPPLYLSAVPTRKVTVLKLFMYLVLQDFVGYIKFAHNDLGCLTWLIGVAAQHRDVLAAQSGDLFWQFYVSKCLCNVMVHQLPEIAAMLTHSLFTWACDHGTVELGRVTSDILAAMAVSDADFVADICARPNFNCSELLLWNPLRHPAVLSDDQESDE
ncbi:hypothetical protein GGF31_006191 [Allomyces arbusculus]|nr:hypothetical protein GGF31_006191 [Allomyces arbusculus]